MNGHDRKCIQNFGGKIEVNMPFCIPDTVRRIILEWISEIGFKGTDSNWFRIWPSGGFLLSRY
jgi:hypothetical protein